jgi:hypothetical protein
MKNVFQPFLVETSVNEAELYLCARKPLLRTIGTLAKSLKRHFGKTKITGAGRPAKLQKRPKEIYNFGSKNVTPVLKRRVF